MLRWAVDSLETPTVCRLWFAESDGSRSPYSCFVAAGGEVKYWNALACLSKHSDVNPAMLTILAASGVYAICMRPDQVCDLAPGNHPTSCASPTARTPYWAGVIVRNPRAGPRTSAELALRCVCAIEEPGQLLVAGRASAPAGAVLGAVCSRSHERS